MKKPNFKEDRCPACGYAVDSISCLTSKEPILPKAGDFSVCLNCGQLNRFNAEVNLVISTPEDQSDLDADAFSQIRKAQRIIGQRGLIA